MSNKPIQKFLQDDKDYFTYSRDLITTHNYRTLTSGCLLYFAVLIFYTVLTYIQKAPFVLELMYLIFDGFHIVLSVVVALTVKKRRLNFIYIQILSVVFELSILCFFMLEGVFTSLSDNALYLPIAILMVLLLFIHKIEYSFVITFLYTAIFTTLSVIFKEPGAVENDIMIALATFIAANIGCILIAKMRHNEAFAIRNYERISQTDFLTDTLNKSAIYALCKKLIAESDNPFFYIIMDMDNFKRVNDDYGHETGDEVIRSIGITLKSCFAPDDYIGRFGGDEFIIIINKKTDITAVIGKVEEAIGKIGELKFSHSELKVNCSAGIAVRNDRDDDRSLLIRADNALYKAKAMGKGNYSIAE